MNIEKRIELLESRVNTEGLKLYNNMGEEIQDARIIQRPGRDRLGKAILSDGSEMDVQYCEYLVISITEEKGIQTPNNPADRLYMGTDCLRIVYHLVSPGDRVE